VKLPEPVAPSRLTEDPKAWPYLKGCIGALDGSYIPVKLTYRERPAGWRDRKGHVTQNVLAACDFELNFVFVFTGTEGSANDSTVLRYAQNRGQKEARFRALPGWFYLADGGYSALNQLLLVPYQKTRYHLREQAAAKDGRPRNKKELFNLRHAQFRNVIERLFGVVKARWPVLALGPHSNTKLKQQKRLIHALAALHNIINQLGQPPEDEDRPVLGVGEYEGVDLPEPSQEVSHNNDQRGRRAKPKDAWVMYRDDVASRMWRAYAPIGRWRRAISQGEGGGGERGI